MQGDLRRAQNDPQFENFAEVRGLSDEEDFRLADMEKRHREDLPDCEGDFDCAQAMKLNCGGNQKAVAERLEVSKVWLSRYLELVRMPQGIGSAVPSILDPRELKRRTLWPLPTGAGSRNVVLIKVRDIVAQQQATWSPFPIEVRNGLLRAELEIALKHPPDAQH